MCSHSIDTTTSPLRDQLKHTSVIGKHNSPHHLFTDAAIWLGTTASLMVACDLFEDGVEYAIKNKAIRSIQRPRVIVDFKYYKYSGNRYYVVVLVGPQTSE